MGNKVLNISAVILAAGSGTRMGADLTKQRMDILGKSVLLHSLIAFDRCEMVRDIVIVTRADEVEFSRETALGISKPVKIVVGGSTRSESARIGFSSLEQDTDFVAIHDAARCLITPDAICEVISRAIECGAATAAAPVTDTVKRVSEKGTILSTVPRNELWAASTPQVFKTDIYASALNSGDIDATDDNMLVENIGVEIACVDVGRENIKITRADDIKYAEYILSERQERRSSGGRMTDLRIGHGYDVHRLGSGRKLILGGVDIPSSLGLIGHSDADVLVHALMDAMLGALALGDIGRHFPDTAEEYKGISSLELLRRVKLLISREGYSVVNVDITVVLQAPKIAGYICEMTENVARILEIPIQSVNIKATTEEHLGFTGRSEGVSAHAVVLLKKG